MSPCSNCRNCQDTNFGIWCNRMHAILPACGIRECTEWEAEE
jgi:hypothetical protein